MTIEVRQMVIKSEVQDKAEGAADKPEPQAGNDCEGCGGGQQERVRERSQLRDTASQLARLRER
ncbi:hypothetical protein [Chitinimonas sp.]|uniref:hypothetical protein n=1 Tax=Chitinimonas sp. TaxID=1934313 RepID=UPI002F9229EF